MLPVATPPNAIVFSSRYVTIQQMAKTGIWMNILGVILITLIIMFYLPLSLLLQQYSSLYKMEQLFRF